MSKKIRKEVSTIAQGSKSTEGPPYTNRRKNRNKWLNKYIEGVREGENINVSMILETGGDATE